MSDRDAGGQVARANGSHMSALGLAELTEIRAALSAGASPGQAIASADSGPLEPVARAVRLGRSLFDEAGGVATGDARADLLVRALGVAERAGAGGHEAVEQALESLRDAAVLERMLAVRTAQARGTARLLALIPLGAWLLLVGLDASALAFYLTPPGLLSGAGAVALGTAGAVWSRRVVGRAELAGLRADPLVPAPPPRDARRALAAAAPVLIVTGVAVGVVPALFAASVAAAVAARPRQVRTEQQAPADPTGGGAAETAELVAVALSAGLPIPAAVGVVASLAPTLARPALAAATRRLRAGWPADEAFAGTGLAGMGDVLATAQRWGAPSAASLRMLADDLRAERRAAAEEAAERVQLALVFPTTLLTLPAFVLGVVPPLLWSALGR